MARFALGIAGTKRTPSLSDIATFAEQGYPDYQVVDWKAVAGPKGMPADVIAFLNKELNEVLKQKAVAERFEAEGCSDRRHARADDADRARRHRALASAGQESQHKSRMSKSLNRVMRQRSGRRGHIMPGAANALAACHRSRRAQDDDAERRRSPGHYLGVPDIGLVSVDRAPGARRRCARRGQHPDPGRRRHRLRQCNQRATDVQLLERAGANAIMLEDQTYPKRCGHFEGKDVIPKQEMVSKLKAAVDARVDPDLMILARTDSRAVEGFEAALDHARAYQEAGADFLFVEAPPTKEELLAIPREVPGSSVQHGDRRQDAAAATRRTGEGRLRRHLLRERSVAGLAARDATGAETSARHRIDRRNRIEADDVRGAAEGAGRGKVQRTGKKYA